jgi:hypothetical protein
MDELAGLEEQVVENLGRAVNLTAGVENDNARRGVRLRHRVDNSVERQRAVLRVVFGINVRIGRQQVV